MSPANASDFLKLGLQLEYLRGANSASAVTKNDVAQFPYLLDNQAQFRYAAKKVAAVIGSLVALLEKLKLTEALAKAGEYRPMLAEVEAYLAQNADPEAVILNDHFIDKIVRIAESVLADVKKEIATSK